MYHECSNTLSTALIILSSFYSLCCSTARWRRALLNVDVPSMYTVALVTAFHSVPHPAMHRLFSLDNNIYVVIGLVSEKLLYHRRQ